MQKKLHPKYQKLLKKKLLKNLTKIDILIIVE
jgi:hypothetical protein